VTNKEKDEVLAKLLLRNGKETDGSSGPARSATALQVGNSPYQLNTRILYNVVQGVTAKPGWRFGRILFFLQKALW